MKHCNQHTITPTADNNSIDIDVKLENNYISPCMEATLASLAVGYSITIEVTGPSINSLASMIPKACNTINVCTIKSNNHIQVELLSLQDMCMYGNKAPSALWQCLQQTCSHSDMNPHTINFFFIVRTTQRMFLIC